VRTRAPTIALFTRSKGRSSPGCFSPSRMTSRSRPRHFCQGSSHGLQSSVRAFHPLAVPARPTPTCALQSVREPEELARLRVPSSVGFLPPLPSP
jgi:hypothetical protein